MKRKVTIVVEMDVKNEQEAKRAVIAMREEMEIWLWNVLEMKLEEPKSEQREECDCGFCEEATEGLK